MEPRDDPRQMKKLEAIKNRLAVHRITYQQIADRRGCSYHQVWRVLNGHRASASILRAAETLIAAAISS